jgi:hypothetical protein
MGIGLVSIWYRIGIDIGSRRREGGTEEVDGKAVKATMIGKPKCIQRIKKKKGEGWGKPPKNRKQRHPETKTTTTTTTTTI